MNILCYVYDKKDNNLFGRILSQYIYINIIIKYNNKVYNKQYVSAIVCVCKYVTTINVNDVILVITVSAKTITLIYNNVNAQALADNVFNLVYFLLL